MNALEWLQGGGKSEAKPRSAPASAPDPVYKERGIGQRFKDAMQEQMLRSPLGAEPGVRDYYKKKGLNDAQINVLERRMLDQYVKQREADPVFRGKGFDLFSPANIGRAITDLAGQIVGGVDASYALGPGKTVAKRIGAQMGINAGVDQASQQISKKRGVIDAVDWLQTGMAAVSGAAIQGGSEVVKGVRNSARLRSGERDPSFADLEKVMLRREGGGTFANPKTSPKGAMGPYQVMPDTARDPGFGVKPWDGKSQEDLGRVGRDYLKAMTHEFKGDHAKVLAAYNAGPHAVKKAVRKHGDKWLDHLPAETRVYVAKSIRELHPRSARAIEEGQNYYDPLDARTDEVLARGGGLEKWMDDTRADLQARVDEIDELEARMRIDEEVLPDEPTRPITEDNVADLGPRIQARDVDQLYTKIVNLTDNVSKAMDEGKIKSSDPTSFEDLRVKINDELQNLDPKSPEYDKMIEMDAMLARSIADMGHNPRSYSVDASEKYFGGDPTIKRPANDANDSDARMADIQRQMDEGTPWKDVSEDDKTFYIETARTAIRNMVGEGKIRPLPPRLAVDNDVVRDPNPPAQLGQPVGTSVNRLDPPKSPEGHGEGPDEPTGPLSDEDLVGKLRDVLGEAQPVRNEQNKLQSKARSERISEVAKVQAKRGGRIGLYEQRAKLKGGLPKVDFHGIADRFSDPEIDRLINMVNDNPRLDAMSKFNAQTGLEKLFEADGALPTPNELELLSHVFPKDVIDNLAGLRAFKTKAANNVAEGINIFRSLMATGDLSAPLRQGILLVGTKEFYKALGPMFKQAISQSAFEEAQDAIAARSTHKLMKRSGLALTNLGRDLTEREEAFMSRLAEKIPGIGRLVKASERGYIGFLNRLRADTFDSLLRDAKDLRINFSHDEKALKDMARYVNAATGRGNLPDMLNAAAPLLNATFFSPRLMASRVGILKGMATGYAGYSPHVRRRAIRDSITSATVVGTVLGLAALSGAEVETDLRSSDAFKIKVGNTRFDVTGGFQAYVRFGAQFITGERKTAKGEVRELGQTVVDDTRLSLTGKFFTNKESPFASLITDWMRGTDPVGNKFTWNEAIANRVVPMFLQDVEEALYEHGAAGLLVAPFSFFGVSAQTYDPNSDEEATSFVGRQISSGLKRVGIDPNPEEEEENESSNAAAAWLNGS